VFFAGTWYRRSLAVRIHRVSGTVGVKAVPSPVESRDPLTHPSSLASSSSSTAKTCRAVLLASAIECSLRPTLAIGGRGFTFDVGSSRARPSSSTLSRPAAVSSASAARVDNCGHRAVAGHDCHSRALTPPSAARQLVRSRPASALAPSCVFSALFPSPPPTLSPAMADTCTPDSSGSNVGAAFGLVAASGMATSLGAAAAFWMPLPKPGARSNPWLAASLGAAAGVMVYVSFVEIFAQKAVGAFQVCIDRSDLAYLYATLCFFGGVALTVAFDVALHAFERWAQRRLARRASTVDAEAEQGQAVPASDIFESDRAAVPTGGTSPDAITVVPVSADTGVSLSDTMGGGHLLATVAAGMEVDAEAARSGAAAGNSSHPSAGDSNWTEDGDADRSLGADAFESTDDKNRRVAMQALTDHHGVQLEPGVLDGAKAKKDLVRMGCFAGVALAAHNFPEGLATFIATLQDPSVGVSVAIAIGIHKYVEGCGLLRGGGVGAGGEPAVGASGAGEATGSSAISTAWCYG